MCEVFSFFFLLFCGGGGGGGGLEGLPCIDIGILKHTVDNYFQ